MAYRTVTMHGASCPCIQARRCENRLPFSSDMLQVPAISAKRVRHRRASTACSTPSPRRGPSPGRHGVPERRSPRRSRPRRRHRAGRIALLNPRLHNGSIIARTASGPRVSPRFWQFQDRGDGRRPSRGEHGAGDAGPARCGRSCGRSVRATTCAQPPDKRVTPAAIPSRPRIARQAGLQARARTGPTDAVRLADRFQLSPKKDARTTSCGGVNAIETPFRANGAG